MENVLHYNAVSCSTLSNYLRPGISKAHLRDRVLVPLMCLAMGDSVSNVVHIILCY